ncbi:MAG: hypothetical protein IT436_12945 [Phycisphaerales bacterium]|nr:hypothetical protein [Phycisphaerales bacterium]
MNALDLLYWPLALITAPAWARKSRGDWRQRFGHTPPLPAPGRKRLLLHAVSVGEVNAIRELIPLLTPHADVVISVGTDTGIARARQLFDGRAAIVRYPLDFSAAVRRFLDAVRPDAVALVELELWPNFIRECGRRGVPVAVINGRLSERSFRGYRKIRAFIGASFRALAFAAVQDEDYARRFRHMGVPPERCRVTGSMKWDAARIEDEVEGSARLFAELGIDPGRPVIVAGSTGPGEEALLHSACPPGVQLVCAPRKPERFDEAAAAVPGCIRRSVTKPGGAGGETPARGSPATDRVSGVRGSDRFLLDTIGELRQAYARADVVVVGRSFMGDLYGSDPVEPIGLGRATVIGPHYGDFRFAVEAFREAGGIRVCRAGDLGGELARLLGSAVERAGLGERGRKCIRSHQGASARHAAMLLQVVGAQVHPGAGSAVSVDEDVLAPG